MQKPENSIFAGNLRRFMDVGKLTQDALAEKLGVDRSSISLYLSGLRMPSMSRIDKLCWIFHCRRADLLDDGTGLTADESALIADFRILDDRDRQVVRHVAETLAEKYPQKKPAVG